MGNAYQNHIRSFYEYVQKSGGLRFSHQFIVKLNFTDFGDAAYGFRGLIKQDYLNTMFGRDWGSILKTGGGNDPKADLTFFATGTSIPQLKMNTSDVAFLAAGFKFPGIVQYDETWNVTILLDQKLYVYTELMYWKQLISSYSRNNGGNKTIPNVDGDIWLLDQYMQQPGSKINDIFKRRFKIKGIFIKELSQVKQQYTDDVTSTKECTAGFAMQWFEQVNVNDGQPLNFDGMGQYI